LSSFSSAGAIGGSCSRAALARVGRAGSFLAGFPGSAFAASGFVAPGFAASRPGRPSWSSVIVPIWAAQAGGGRAAGPSIEINAVSRAGRHRCPELAQRAGSGANLGGPHDDRSHASGRARPQAEAVLQGSFHPGPDRDRRELVDAGAKWVFGVINLMMWAAPLGVFGAMAFTVGRYGIMSLGPLVKLIGVFYLINVLFLGVIFGAIAWAAGFSLAKFLLYIKEEILIVFGTSSSDSGLPGLMAKMEFLGCSKSVVGFVVPTSYIFNTVGSSLYMTLAAFFVAQATNTELTFIQQVAIFAVAILTSKGASGVTGASFIALVATLAIVPTIPVAGMALILGIDGIMSEARALMNMISAGVAAAVLAKFEGELDEKRMHAVLDGEVRFEDYRLARSD
jgi:aerobic C4-dicarboxylate transport protein